MKKQKYLCVDLMTLMQKCDIRVGEVRNGLLKMTQEQEQFEFVEQSHARWTRNPKVWEGAYINVHLDKNGHYQVHLKKMELHKRLNVTRVAKAIETELRTAKKMLALCD